MSDIVKWLRMNAYGYGNARCEEAADTITALRAEIESYKQSFDMRWEADMRGIKRWQEAHPGNDLVWPDHADMVVWLLEQDTALRAENERLRAVLKMWDDAVKVDVKMQGPQYVGVKHLMGRIAWKATCAILEENAE